MNEHVDTKIQRVTHTADAADPFPSTTAWQTSGAAKLPPGRVIINRRQLLQKVPLSERTILELERRGEFPKRFTVSTRVVVWDLAEVDAWIAVQRTAAVQQLPPWQKKTD